MSELSREVTFELNLCEERMTVHRSGEGEAFQAEETGSPKALKQELDRLSTEQKEGQSVCCIMSKMTGKRTSGLMWVGARESVSSGREFEFYC